MKTNGYQHMVLDDYVRRLREIRVSREKRLASLRTVSDVTAYREHCLAAVKRAFSPVPRRCALEPRITGTLQRSGYRIEKLLVQSRPGFFVSANLYVPEEGDGPFPVVLAPCGHSMEGKAAPVYQAFCQRLVVNGFMVLIYEPCNQGERDQYFNVPDRECVRSCCSAHNMMGKQMELLGEYYGMWRAWDGIRCLDYLLSRPDADATRVGVTGNSGGGTMSEWLWAVDDRFTMAAPSCFVTAFLSNLENELPSDVEQYPPGVIGAGLEMVDLMVPRAPKPVLLLGQKHDFFDRRGLVEAHRDLAQIYALLGAEDNLELFIGPTIHGYSEHNQRAMVEFFCKHAGISSPVHLGETEAVSVQELRVTPQGEVVQAGSRPVFELLADKARDYAEKRSVLSGDALRRAVTRALALPEWRAGKVGVAHYRIPNPVRIGSQTYARYAVETERDIRAILKKRLPNASLAYSLDVEPEVHVFLPHVSGEDDFAEEPWTQAINAGGALYAIDPRGLGESLPEPHGSAGFFQPYGMDYMLHGHGVLFGESYCGRRVYDVLRVLELLRHEGACTIHLHGRGQGAILALFAATVDSSVASVDLRNAPASYRDWVEAPIVLWPAACGVRNALRKFDLPDLTAALGEKLTSSDPWGPDMRPTAGQRAAR